MENSIQWDYMVNKQGIISSSLKWSTRQSLWAPTLHPQSENNTLSVALVLQPIPFTFPFIPGPFTVLSLSWFRSWISTSSFKVKAPLPTSFFLPPSTFHRLPFNQATVAQYQDLYSPSPGFPLPISLLIHHPSYFLTYTSIQTHVLPKTLLMGFIPSFISGFEYWFQDSLNILHSWERCPESWSRRICSSTISTVRYGCSSIW